MRLSYTANNMFADKLETVMMEGVIDLVLQQTLYWYGLTLINSYLNAYLSIPKLQRCNRWSFRNGQVVSSHTS